MNAAFNLPHFARSARFCIAVAIFGMLAACGQRGPLYLPKPLASSVPAKPATAPVTTVAPATTPATSPTEAPADPSPINPLK